jgi:hypothetical protein
MTAGNDETVEPWNGTWNSSSPNPEFNSSFRNATEPLFEGDLEGVLFAPGVSTVGEGVFAMFLCGIVIIPLWARTEDPTLPAITLAMFSGMAIPLLPGMLLGVAWGVLWISGTVALFGLVQILR